MATRFQYPADFFQGCLGIDEMLEYIDAGYSIEMFIRIRDSLPTEYLKLQMGVSLLGDLDHLIGNIYAMNAR